MYSGFSSVDLRVPGGAATQPAFSATRFTYSFEVAHFTKDLAAAACFVVEGMASDQAQNQPAPREVTSVGACAKASTSPTLEVDLL